MPPIPDRRSYATVTSPDRVYRVCRTLEPTHLRPWNTITPEFPLEERWDDSYGQFRVLYTSDSAKGALRETLQRFVPSAELLDRLAAIETDEEEDVLAGINSVPISWLATRYLGEIAVEPCLLVDVLHARSLDTYAHEYDQRLTVGELLAVDTRLSRQMARRMYSRSDHFAGIAAISKLGSNIVNYSFFELDRGALRAHMRKIIAEPLTPNVPALFDVVNQLGLVFEGVWLPAGQQWVPSTPAALAMATDEQFTIIRIVHEE